MTPKERLDKLVKYVSVAIDGRWDLLTEDTKYPLMQTEEYKEVIDALTELEELKRDVKRYFELEGNYQKGSHGYHEMEYIKSKLSKVGKEDV